VIAEKNTKWRIVVLVPRFRRDDIHVNSGIEERRGRFSLVAQNNRNARRCNVRSRVKSARCEPKRRRLQRNAQERALVITAQIREVVGEAGEAEADADCVCAIHRADCVCPPFQQEGVRKRGRVHPAYVVGGSLLVLVQGSRHLIVDSEAWRGACALLWP
jgi:hypothetical protein